MNRSREGLISVLALIFLSILAVLAIAGASLTMGTLQRGENQIQGQQAALEAESGVAFCTYEIAQCRLPAGLQGQAMLSSLAVQLGDRINGVAHASGTVTCNGSVISFPTITTDDGLSFNAVMSLYTGTIGCLTVTGHNGTAMRAVSMNLKLVPGGGYNLKAGVASRSPIVLTGNDRISGATIDDASLLSATFTTTTAVSMTGNAKIDGNIYIPNPSGTTSMVGNVSVGGASGSARDAHVFIGGDVPDFPEVDPSVFAPYATTNITASTPTSGNRTFSNIRIKAGANPNFSGNITIKGIVYVEKPNKITFTGNLTLTGLIVTEDAGDNVYAQNYIRFAGNMSSTGVENLPDTAEFHDLRNMPGAFILAPGFGLQFTGNFGTCNGAMVADAFTFTGNAGGTVYGPVINYSDSEFRMTGNSTLNINRTRYGNNIPGLVSKGRLLVDATTYLEH